MLDVFQELSALERRIFAILAIAALLFWIGITAFLPTLPPYLESIGFTSADIGWAMAAFGAGLLILRPWCSQLIDTKGARSALQLGAIVLCLAPIGYFFAKDLPTVALIRAFHGFCIASFPTAFSALVTLISPPEKRGQLIGYMSLVLPIGMAIGPAIGGFLAASKQYKSVFAMSIVAGISCLGCVAAIPRLPTAATPADNREPTPWGKLLRDRSLLVMAAVLSCAGFAFGALTTFIPLFVDRSGVDFNVGWLYAAAAVASFASRVFLGTLSDRYGRGIFISLSTIAYILSMLVIANAKEPVSFLLGGCLEGFATGTIVPMTIALIADRTLPATRASAFAICFSGFDLGMAVANPVFGSLVLAIGYPTAYLGCAFLATVGLVLFATCGNRTLGSSLKFACGRCVDGYSLNR
jgi:MFS family permease